MAVLFLPHPYTFYFFVILLCWLGLPVQYWMKVAMVGILVLKLTLKCFMHFTLERILQNFSLGFILFCVLHLCTLKHVRVNATLILYLFLRYIDGSRTYPALLIWVLRWMTLQHSTFSYNAPICLSKRPAWHCPFDLEKSYISWLFCFILLGKTMGASMLVS